MEDSLSMICFVVATLSSRDTKGGLTMADKDLWTAFRETGSIVDYLNYKGYFNEESRRDGSGLGESRFESDNYSDRNDSGRNSNW